MRIQYSIVTNIMLLFSQRLIHPISDLVVTARMILTLNDNSCVNNRNIL